MTFKVAANASSYRLDIYRLGFYQGHGARLVDTVRPFAQLPQVQPACYRDSDTHLLDCGTWAESAAWQVPSDAVSGLYIARAVRTDPIPQRSSWRTDNSQLLQDWHHGRPGADPFAPPAVEPHAYGAGGLGTLRNPIREPRASHIWFVVRDDDNTGMAPSQLVFQTSDPT